MRAATSIFLYEENEKFFGEGPYRLLRTVEETGSLRAAAMSMNMSYSKATHIVSRAEKVLGFALTEKNIGGKGGGGSVLTNEAKAFLDKYEAYREACYEANSKLYNEFFSEK